MGSIKFLIRSEISIQEALLSIGGIRLGINYSVLDEMKQNE